MRRYGWFVERLEDRTLPSASSADLLALPLSFEANTGQTDSQVQFLARGLGYGLFLTPGQAVLNLYDPGNQSDSGTVLRAQFVGANLAAQVGGLDPLPGHANYYIGQDAARWQTDVSLYSRVRYEGIYPGVDLVYYGTNQQQLEYDFVVTPGADPGVIKISYEGANGIELDAQGNLVLHTDHGDVIQHAPIVYQDGADGRRAVAGSFVLQGNEVGFQLGDYDRGRQLVIDPVLVYSTYLGGSGLDEILDIDVRPYYQTQYMYVTGYTRSVDFPATTGASMDRSLGGSSDAFVFRMELDTNGSGTRLLYATYLGGSGRENDFAAGGGEAAVAVGNAYNTFVTGMTQSADFPTTASAFQTNLKGTQDAFVAQLTSSGALVYSTYLGGTGNDAGTGIVVDNLNYPADFAVVTGWTSSTNFPVQGAIQSASGGGVDAFVAMINPSGRSLLYSTYLGGNNNDVALDIGLDPSNDAFVTGRTSSSDFPTTFGMDRTLDGTSDAFVAKINLAGTALLFSTFLGGRGDEDVDAAHGTDVGALAVDALGNVYVTGSTASDNFPLFAPFDSVLGAGGTGWDAFVTKLDGSGSTIYSTYLGGALDDFGLGIDVNRDGLAILTGATESADFPMQNPGQGTRAGNRDAFVTAYDAAGTGLVFSTFLGGAGGGEGTTGRGIAVDSRNQVYVVGGTDSAAFPTLAPYAPNTATFQSGPRGGGDGFLTKLAFLPGVSIYSVYSYSGLPVTEGGPTSTYQLKLLTAPAANVTITVNPDSQVSVAPAVLTFTPTSWNTWQRLTVTAVDDGVVEASPHRGIISHTTASTDPAYNGLTFADVTADIEDNDTPGVVYGASVLLNSLAEGSTIDGRYTFQLTSRPTANVVMTAVPDGQVLISPNGSNFASAAVTLTFTSANWYAAQSVYVTAIDDLAVEGSPHLGIVTNTAVSADPNYNGISLRTVTTRITDNDTPGFTFAQVGTNSVSVTEAGNDDTYTVVLKTLPTANVVLTQSPNAQQSVAPALLTFTPANWNVIQTVTVTAVDDAAVESTYPNSHSGTISYSVASADANYDAFVVANMPVSVRDNDTVGVYLGGTGTVLSEGGTSDDYGVVLTSTPSANVVISLDAGTQLAVAPVLVTFTPANWYIGQTINVTSIQDGLVEPSPHSGLITHTVTSADAGYNGRAVANITASITDDDVADMILLETSTSTDVSEIGPTADTYTVRLGSQPFFDVFVTINPGTQFTLSAPVLTFTGTNWNTPQTLTVTALDDFIDETSLHTGILSHVVTSADLLYNGWALAAVTASIVDNDTAGVTVTTTGRTDVSEGGSTDTYAIVLNSQPTANVLITLRPDAQASVSPGGVLTFDAGNWNVPQTVTVAAIHDFLVESPLHQGVVRHTLTSADPFFSGLAVASVTATITEIDVGGVAVTESGGTTQVDEAGAADTFAVRLNTLPTANVVINLGTSTQVTLSTPRLTFTPANWTVEQTVTLAAVNDVVAEGQHAAIISLTPASADLLYNSLTIRSITADILDNDVVQVIQSSGTTLVSEAGTTDSYTLQLATMPTANVLVTVQSDSQVTASPSPNTFTPGNWNVPQTVTVAAVNDLVAEGPHSGILRHTSTSADPFYDAVIIDDVVAQITDDDIPVVTVSPSGGSTNVTEGIAGDLYDVVLQTQPTADVTLLVSADASLQVAPTTLVFTPLNWSVPQTVTVTAPDNGTIDGIRTANISHVALSADPFYQGLAVSGLAVSVHDPSGYTLTSTSGRNAALEGTALSYSMVLNTAPLADVYVDLAGDSQATVATTRLVFTAADWNVPHPVIVTARDDSAVEGLQAGLIGLVFTSSDSAYESLGLVEFPVAIVDNDGEPVLGTAGADRIVVSSSANRSQILVSVNSKVVSYPATLAQLVIQAGDGNDYIEVQNPTLPISILGGRGTDKVFVNGRSGANSFVLDSASVAANGIGVLVWDIESLILNGQAGSDVLQVDNVPAFDVEFKGGIGNDLVVAGARANTWQVTTANGGVLDQRIKLNAVENWTGGAGVDTFVFSPGKALSGTIDGGGGFDILDYSACTAAITVNLQSQQATGTRGVQNITAIAGGKSTGDKLIGANQANVWSITATNTGSLNGLTFQGIENLTGGSQADVFRLANNQGVRGKIDGAGGSDTLDYAAYLAHPVTINLQAKSATSTGGFLNLEQFQGGAGQADTLIGTNASSAWSLTGTGAGSIASSLAPLAFAGFENLTGGSLVDTFDLAPGAGWVGALNGGAGKDTLRAAPGQPNAWTNTASGSGTLNGRKFLGIEVRL